MGWEERSDGSNDSDDTVCRNSVKDTPQSVALPSRSHTAQSPGDLCEAKGVNYLGENFGKGQHGGIFSTH